MFLLDFGSEWVCWVVRVVGFLAGGMVSFVFGRYYVGLAYISVDRLLVV